MSEQLGKMVEHKHITDQSTQPTIRPDAQPWLSSTEIHPLYLDGVQGNAEFAVDSGRGRRRVVEREHAEGRRQRLLPGMP